MTALWTANEALPATVTWGAEDLALAAPEGTARLTLMPGAVSWFLEDLRAWLFTRKGCGLHLLGPTTGVALTLDTEQVLLLAAVVGTTVDDAGPALSL